MLLTLALRRVTTFINHVLNTHCRLTRWALILPPELRRMILIEAFGNRTLHIHLGLNHPLISGLSGRDRYQPGHVAHGSASVPLEENMNKPRTENRDTSKPKEWQWWSCVCHRRDPAGELFVPPHYDECLNGRAQCCRLWPGEASAKCQIGVEGWLQTCRQAYEEGVDVLFSTNTMFWYHGPLLDALLRQNENPKRSLIPQANIDLITSLLIRSEFKLFSGEPKGDDEARASMNENLRLLSRACPGLKMLYISFADGMYHRCTRPDEALDEVDAALLEPLGAILKQPSRLITYTVSLPINIFEPLDSRARREGNEIVKTKDLLGGKFWYPVRTDGLDS